MTVVKMQTNYFDISFIYALPRMHILLVDP
ncbi:hypothetical protein DSL99_1751 [Leeuwenhoekiella marinoflava]|uniref:Uncharacterized protein n=1 Tax=Leeuwenhoekiella marinoflava TaxID=988 RepID=A0A4Q0PLY8_9FLAO|nr:hypothetical protein DSL99_1751 [Leeuwenhoekiella marinoflava]